jgi:hypothetical protein
MKWLKEDAKLVMQYKLRVRAHCDLVNIWNIAMGMVLR